VTLNVHLAQTQRWSTTRYCIFLWSSL